MTPYTYRNDLEQYRRHSCPPIFAQKTLKKRKITQRSKRSSASRLVRPPSAAVLLHPRQENQPGKKAAWTPRSRGTPSHKGFGRSRRRKKRRWCEILQRDPPLPLDTAESGGGGRCCMGGGERSCTGGASAPARARSQAGLERAAQAGARARGRLEAQVGVWMGGRPSCGQGQAGTLACALLFAKYTVLTASLVDSLSQHLQCAIVIPFELTPNQIHHPSPELRSRGFLHPQATIMRSRAAHR